MAEHNTPFSEGTIEGILRDFVKCTREQTLMGNTVKVDNLAIFKVSVMGNGCSLLYDPDTDKTISASIGTLKKTDKTGPAVDSLKLLAQATGDYTREELNKDGRLAWTDKAAAQIAAAKGALWRVFFAIYAKASLKLCIRNRSSFQQGYYFISRCYSHVCYFFCDFCECYLVSVRTIF